MKRKSFVLMTSLFIAVFMSIFMVLGFLSAITQIRLIETERSSMYAFYAAEAALERTIFELRRDMAWGSGIPAGDPINGCPEMTGSLCQDVEVRLDPADPASLRGTYSIISGGPSNATLDPPWIVVPFQIEGSSTDSDAMVTRVLDVQIRTQSPVAFSFFTLGDLAIGGGAIINNSGSDIFTRDISFEAVPGETIDIDGNIRYMRNLSGYPDPSVNVTGSVEQTEPTTFIGVDFDYYSDLAQSGGNYISGDFTYSGDISPADLGTDNGILCVDGDIEISGEVIEPVVIVASGDIHITDDITYSPSSPDAQIGIFAAGDVIIDEDAAGGDGNLDVNGLIIADGGVFSAEGANYSENQLNFSGAILVRGKSDARSSIDLNVFKTRVYSDDPNLYLNPSLPFMTFLVNLGTWSEANLPAIQAVQ